MIKNEVALDKLNKLIQYYQDKGLLIIGLNDYKRIKAISPFWERKLLEYLALSLTSKDLTPNVIDAFSFTMNKTEHVNYFLQNNLNLWEVKLSQVYSVISALEKTMKDIGLPQTLSIIGNLYRLVYLPKKEDKNIKITSALQEAVEPMVIYSSGLRDIMLEIGLNPFQIRRDYHLRNTRPNYNYAVEKAQDPMILSKIMNEIEKNYETILGFNDKTDIYALNAYVPKALEGKGMAAFKDLIMAYNEKLFNLCSQYGVSLIDVTQVDKDDNEGVNKLKSYKDLANIILESMYEDKLNSSNKTVILRNGNYQISDGGVIGLILDITKDYNHNYDNSLELTGYAQKKELDIVIEHSRELGVFQKVLLKERKIR